MSGDLSLQHPTYMKALQKAGYYTSGIGKFHFLQTWQWGAERGKGVNLVELKEDIKKYGYDYVWETSGKQLALRNYCDYSEYLDKKGILEEYRDFVESAGANYYTPDQNTDNANPWPFPEEDYVDIVTGDKIVERIKDRPEDQPFFIFGSFCSPHKPYDPPQRYLEMVEYEEEDDFILAEDEYINEKDKKRLYRQRRAAKAMIHLIDEQVGRIFEKLEEEGLLEDTVIMFTTDHGDMLGDHYRLQKSVYWKEACTVPTSIRHPEYLDKQINNSPVSIIDLAATILDIAEIDPQEGLSKDWPAFNNIVPSCSLMPIVKGEEDSIREYTFTECKNEWQMIKTERYKYIKHLGYKEPGQFKEEFYDLKNDRDELVNQIDNPDYYRDIEYCRQCREYVVDSTPPAQTRWAPLM